MLKFTRVLVCGGRDYEDRDKVYNVLDKLNKTHHPLIIISGMARGADSFAADWGRNRMVVTLEFPANWKLCGRSAGAIRNQQMLEEGNPDLVVAFPGNKGTADMVKRAKKAGVEVMLID